MPIHITVPAMTIGELRSHTGPSLEWRYAVRVRRYAEGWNRLWMGIPECDGVYVWVARPSEAVIYVGCATGARGLRKRLVDQFVWIQEAEACQQRDQDNLADNYPGHPRTVLAMDGSVYWAVTEEAAAWERRLLQLSVRLTGIVPIINGGAWWSNGEAADRARSWVDGVLLNSPAAQS